jgi:hypothetical protein
MWGIHCLFRFLWEYIILYTFCEKRMCVYNDNLLREKGKGLNSRPLEEADNWRSKLGSAEWGAGQSD